LRVPHIYGSTLNLAERGELFDLEIPDLVGLFPNFSFRTLEAEIACDQPPLDRME